MLNGDMSAAGERERERGGRTCLTLFLNNVMLISHVGFTCRTCEGGGNRRTKETRRGFSSVVYFCVSEVIIKKTPEHQRSRSTTRSSGSLKRGFVWSDVFAV